MATPKKHLTAAQLRDWAARAQLRFLEGVMQCGAWRPNELAFHGGTSLHMSWASPRFSEDLDFLLERSKGDLLPKIMGAIEKRLREQFLADDVGFNVEIRNKTRDDSRLGNFHIVVSHSAVLGNAMVKAEFWMVEAGYLDAYPTAFRTPVVAGDVVTNVTASMPVPAAELATAYGDKLTAFATRPHLKWRDLFDLWWMGTQARAVDDPASPAVLKQFLHNLSGYNTVGGLPPEDVLGKFCAIDNDRLVAAATKDLKPWLPPRYWETLGDAGVRKIVEYVKSSLGSVETALRDRNAAQAAAEATGAKKPPRRSKP